MTASTASCPVCQQPLRPTTHEHMPVLECAGGHGTYLSADALTAIVRDQTNDRSVSEEQAAEAAQTPVAAQMLETRETPRACPTCGATMSSRIYAYESGVAIDVCDAHGIWLDSSELERIEAWYEAQIGHLAEDRAAWGGQDGKLEQIEERSEREAAQQTREAWGILGPVVGPLSWWWSRRDD